MKTHRTWFVMLIVLVASCGRKPQSLWQEPAITVMADPTDWIEIRDVMKRIYEREIRTPQNEKTYVLMHAPDSLFDYHAKQRYLILAGTLNSTGSVGRLIQRMASDPSIRQSIEREENFVFVRKNEWAYDQTMVILIGKDTHTLKQKIETHQHFLYDLIDVQVKQFMKKEVLEGRIHKELTAELMDKYQFSMQMQKDYFLAQDFPEKNFLWMHRLAPSRWIFVRWWDEADPDTITREWVIRERDVIGKTFYTDYQEQVNPHPKFLLQSEGLFQGRNAVITNGLWERIDDTQGGPFKNYTFYDAPTERIYMIDVAVHAPGKQKIPYLRRADVIAETFRTLFDEPFTL